MVLDAACGVAGPLRHLTGDTGKPALAGSGPGGFGLEAALDESRGFLLIPFVVEGTAAHPVFRPDMKALATEQLKNQLKNLTKPDAMKAATGILKGLLGGKKN